MSSTRDREAEAREAEARMNEAEAAELIDEGVICPRCEGDMHEGRCKGCGWEEPLAYPNGEGYPI